MKKTKTMRIASIILVAVLLSTCAISGTFAKYVTSGTANDEARVAKWGIEIATWNTDDTEDKVTSIFSSSYETDNETVVAADAKALLVAPGTKNDTGVTFSVKGQAETDLKLDFVMNVTKDVVVPQGEYLDWTTANSTTDTYKVENEDYYPVVFTLTQTKKTALNMGEAVSGNLAAIETAFEKLTQATVEANTKLDEEWTLTWAWTFEVNDQADTTLGNKAAGLTDVTATAVVTDLAYDIKITATQID